MLSKLYDKHSIFKHSIGVSEEYLIFEIEYL